MMKRASPNTGKKKKKHHGLEALDAVMQKGTPLSTIQEATNVDELDIKERNNILKTKAA